MDEIQGLHVDVTGYLLGMLEFDEAHAVESHLETCATCRAEFDELADLPALLDLAASTEAASAESGSSAAVQPVSAPVADLAEIRRARPRRVGRWLTAAAAAAVLIAGSAVVATRDGDDDSLTVALQPQGSVAATGTAELSDLDSGTGVRLRLENVEPTADGERLECWWVDADGVRVSAGSFLVDESGVVDVQLTTATPRTPGWRLNVNRVSADGQETNILSAESA